MWLWVLIAGLSSYAEKPLEGVWLRACQNGALQIQMFEGNNNYADDLFFEDLHCKKPSLAFSNEGYFQIENQRINYRFEKVKLTLYTPALVADYNQRQVCNFQDWKANTPREITGLKCALFQQSKLIQVPRKGDPRFGIWKFEGGRLYFGLLSPKHDGSTPDKRPVEWDLRPYFKQL